MALSPTRRAFLLTTAGAAAATLLVRPAAAQDDDEEGGGEEEVVYEQMSAAEEAAVCGALTVTPGEYLLQYLSPTVTHTGTPLTVDLTQLHYWLRTRDGAITGPAGDHLAAVLSSHGKKLDTGILIRLKGGRLKADDLSTVLDLLDRYASELKMSGYAEFSGLVDELNAEDDDRRGALKAWVEKYVMIDCNGFAGSWALANGFSPRVTAEADFSSVAPLDMATNTPAAKRRKTLSEVCPGDFIVYLGVSHVAVVEEVDRSTGALTMAQSWSEGGGTASSKGVLSAKGTMKKAIYTQSWMEMQKDPRYKTESPLAFPLFGLTPSGMGERDVTVVGVL